MPSALIIGGTGLVGGAVARRLRSAGWRITVTGRDPRRMPYDLTAAGVRFVAADRDDPVALAVAAASGCDLLVDCVCFTAAQARLILPLMRDTGSAVMISSRAVYVDDAGNHVNSAFPPRFPGPVTEDRPTLKPGDMPYNSPQGYGANKVAAEHVLLDSGLPVTVLRPSKVHGRGAESPREWYFVKRLLDRRPVLLLAGRGRGIDQQSAAVNIAALVQAVAYRPGRRILNAADPDAPDGLTISRLIAAMTGHTWAEVLLAEDTPSHLGDHPWHRPSPIVLDTGAARALGYQPVGDYAATVPETVGWLFDQATGRPGWAPPGIGREVAERWFDYPAEDAWLRSLLQTPRR